MRLALKELRRRPQRFSAATVILTLIAILLMFLGGLLDGLVAGNTGALRAQRADVIVFSSSAQESLVRSRIDPALRREVAAVPGVAAVGGLGSVQLGARLEDRDPRDLVSAVLFGYELAPSGLPATPPARGAVYADVSLRAKGVERGALLRLGPARTPVRVVGFVADTRYSGQGTLWGSLETWRAVLDANRPSNRLGEGVAQALAVAVARGSDAAEVASSIDSATGDATRSLTVAGAIDALPGLAQQQRVFGQIIGVTLIIAVFVVALFFALITVERTALYGVLKAIGASSSTLLGGVVLQAVVVTLVASLIAAVTAIGVDALVPAGGIPFIATSGRILSSTAFLLVASIVGCAFSLRRVLSVEPATAIGSAQ